MFSDSGIKITGPVCVAAYEFPAKNKVNDKRSTIIIRKRRISRLISITFEEKERFTYTFRTSEHGFARTNKEN